MGVTLERVQFKFASIIGELCSEPDILSQFAVWVDLRLAEYKLKGSISLDCSGDTPDPVWLKGILSALLAKRLSKRREQSNPASHSFGDSPLGNGSYSYMSSPMSRTQREMSRDDTRVNIKEEPCEDGVFPVKFHKNQTAAAHRKRSATETVTSEEDSVKDDVLYSHSTSKHRRTESTAQASNESLMSIIGVEEQQDNASEMYDNIKDTIDLIVDSEEMGNAGQEATNVSSSTVYHSDDRAASTSLDRLQDNSFTSPNTVGLGQSTSSGEARFAEGHQVATRLQRSPSVQEKTGQNISTKKLSHQTSKNMNSAVGIFKRWFAGRFQEDERSIDEIPPQELDTVLAEFFSSVRKTSGGDYIPHSFDTLRTSLERHLRFSGYPVSITRSEVFKTSQEAFALRKLQLRASLNMSMVLQHVNETVHRTLALGSAYPTQNDLE